MTMVLPYIIYRLNTMHDHPFAVGLSPFCMVELIHLRQNSERHSHTVLVVWDPILTPQYHS